MHSIGRRIRLQGYGILVWLPLSFFYLAVLLCFEILNRKRLLGGSSYILGFFAISLAYLILFRFRMKERSETLGVVCGLVLRIILVFLLPIFEDDWARYLWDGFQTKQNGTPYGIAPEIFFSDPDPIHSEILSRINHPDWPTIYAPILEIYFFIIHLFIPWKLWALKLFLLIPDLALFYLIRNKFGRSSALLYFWNPVLLKEIFLNAHPDILGIFLLFFSFVLVEKGRIKTGFFVWGLSLAAKNFGLLLFPFLVLSTMKRRNPFCSANLKQSIPQIPPFEKSKTDHSILPTIFIGILFTSMAVGISYLPFLLYSKETDLGVVSRFINGFEFFPLGHSWLKSILGEFSRLVWKGIVIASILFLLYSRNLFGISGDAAGLPTGSKDPDPFLRGFQNFLIRFAGRDRSFQRKVGIVFFLFFFFSPVVNAWYLLWMLPFLLPVSRSFGPSWCFLFLGQLSYLNFANLGDWSSVLEKGYYSHPQWLLLSVSAILGLAFLAFLGSRVFCRISFFSRR
ncbi:hypothetical protein [Leptospira langatensis]|uniref:hypothetical protein n=1 Tax=Leptospira langatensis TaxID=2484983 RepID=UPI001FE2E345|nr:hypothetical protein [Leptospira langatensis]